MTRIIGDGETQGVSVVRVKGNLRHTNKQNGTNKSYNLVLTLLEIV